MYKEPTNQLRLNILLFVMIGMLLYIPYHIFYLVAIVTVSSYVVEYLVLSVQYNELGISPLLTYMLVMMALILLTRDTWNKVLVIMSQKLCNVHKRHADHIKQKFAVQYK